MPGHNVPRALTAVKKIAFAGGGVCAIGGDDTLWLIRWAMPAADGSLRRSWENVDDSVTLKEITSDGNTVYGIDMNGALRRIGSAPDVPGGVWGRWESIDDTVKLKKIAVASGYDVFGIDADDALRYVRWTSGGGWGRWENAAADVNQIFGIETNGDVRRIRRPNQQINIWAGWEHLNGVLKQIAAVPFSRPSEVFGIGSDDQLWHNKEIPSGSGGSPVWAGWESLDGGLKQIVVGPLGNEVFGIGTDGAFWHMARGGGWKPVDDSVKLKEIAVKIAPGGEGYVIELYAIGTDEVLRFKGRSVASDGNGWDWGSWEILGV